MHSVSCRRQAAFKNVLFPRIMVRVSVSILFILRLLADMLLTLTQKYFKAYCVTRFIVSNSNCLSFLRFFPPIDPTCCLPLLLFQSTLLHILQWQMIHLSLPHVLASSFICQSFHQSINVPLSSPRGFFC